MYVEDEAELSLFPTLTRMWMLRGQQRKIRAPGLTPPKRHEYGGVDWRTGDLIQIRAPRRNSEAFCRLVEKCLSFQKSSIPKYSPECMPMELFWNDWRDNVTHNHDRTALHELTADSDRYLRRRRHNPQAVLRTLGSPFARRQRFKT